MKIFPTLALSALLLLPPAFAETEQEPCTFNKDIPACVTGCMQQSPALREWHNALETAWKRAQAEDDLTPEGFADLRKKTDATLDSVDKLYRARLTYGFTSIWAGRYDQTENDQVSEDMQNTWVGLVEASLLQDLQAYMACSVWCGEFAPQNIDSSGLLRHFPRSQRVFTQSYYRGSIDHNMEALQAIRNNMTADVDDFRAKIQAIYAEPLEQANRDLVTQRPYAMMDGGNGAALREQEAKLFNEAEDCWETYRKTLSSTLCPSDYYAFESFEPLPVLFECLLMEGEDLYLASVASGMEYKDPEPESEVVGLVAVLPFQELGEICRANVSVSLEDGEWCATFTLSGGTVTLPLATGAERDSLLAVFPQGAGSVNVRGYQDIEVTGKPYVEGEQTDDTYQARVVFRILSFEKPEE